MVLAQFACHACQESATQLLVRIEAGPAMMSKLQWGKYVFTPCRLPVARNVIASAALEVPAPTHSPSWCRLHQQRPRALRGIAPARGAAVCAPARYARRIGSALTPQDALRSVPSSDR